MLHPRGKTYRTLAVLTAVGVFNLEMVALMHGRLTLPTARAQAQPEAPARAAAEERRVALIVFPRRSADEGDAQVLQTLMRQEVERLKDVSVVTGSPDPAEDAQSVAADLVEAGFRALNVRDHVEAEARLSEAYEKLIRHTGPLDRRLMARALKGLGVARVMAGQMRAGKDMMRASLNLWPEQIPPEYGYTLDVLNAFKDVQRQRTEQASGSVDVVTEPAGAEVRIDGEVRGYSPVSVPDLAPGMHWVQAQLDGYVRQGSLVEVPSGEAEQVRYSLQARQDHDAYSDVMGDVQRRFGSRRVVGRANPKLIDMLRADDVLLVQVDPRGNGYRLTAWHGDAEGVEQAKKTIQRDADFLSNIQSFLTATLGAELGAEEAALRLDAPPKSSVLATGEEEEDLYIDPDDPILKSPEEEEEESVTSKWWFWAIVGGVAAGAVAGGVVLFSGTDAGSGPTGDITVDLHGLQ
ncbi:MAG: PEGA domain-containing protein [Myxococcota bacterium]